MRHRWLASIIGTTLLASAGLAHARDTPGSTSDEPEDFSGVDVAPPVDKAKTQAPREVSVEGIEGTMSAFDVSTTLDARGADFDQCHERHGHGSGKLSFRIHVLSTGEVGRVKVRRSKVRNRQLVDCYADVVSSTRFFPPHGGYADVEWSTKVGRSQKKLPEHYVERRGRWDTPVGGVAEPPARYGARPKASSEDRAEGEGRRGRRHRHHRRHHSRRHHRRGS